MLCSLLLHRVTNPPPDFVPNPAKVLIILEELGLPYQSSWVELEDLKKEPFESVNPNGRVPGIANNILPISRWLGDFLHPVFANINQQL